MKGLAKEFKGEFACLRENTDKYKSFSVLMKNTEEELVKREKKLQKPYPKNKDPLAV